MKMISKFYIISCLILVPFSLWPQAGTIDSSFGMDGYFLSTQQVFIIGNKNLAIQPDKKILMIGSFEWGWGDTDLALIRVTEDGQLDESFGDNGYAIQNFQANNGGKALVLQPDGKIVALGSTGFNWVLMRYHTNGILDDTFGNDGVATIHIPPNVADSTNVGLANLALQSDGKIVVAGDVGEEYGDIMLLRYNNDGSRDNTFGTNGIVRTRVSNKSERCSSVEIQQDGKIIIGGSSMALHPSSETHIFMILRYNTDGSLDTTFNHNGIVFTDHDTPGFSRCHSLAIQQDGKIVGAGSVEFGFGIVEMTLVRYNLNGSLDTAFGDSGIVVENISPYPTGATDLIFQPDGKIIVGGAATDVFHTNLMVSRFNADGSVDYTFGSNGMVITDLGSAEGISAIDLQDNKLIAGGRSYSVFMIMRYLLDFSLGTEDFSANEEHLLIYPNPVKETSILKYTLENKSKVSMRLYDMNGTLIESFLSSQKQQAGEHSVSINWPEEMASGMYILEITAGNRTAAIRIMKG